MADLPVASVDNDIAGELCTQRIGRFRQPATGPDQVTDSHALFKRVFTGVTQQTSGPDHPGRLPVGCLLVQHIHQRFDDFTPITIEAKQDQLIPRLKLNVLC